MWVQPWDEYWTWCEVPVRHVRYEFVPVDCLCDQCGQVAPWRGPAYLPIRVHWYYEYSIIASAQFPLLTSIATIATVSLGGSRRIDVRPTWALDYTVFWRASTKMLPKIAPALLTFSIRSHRSCLLNVPTFLKQTATNRWWLMTTAQC